MATTISSSDLITMTIRPWKDIFQDITNAGCNLHMVSAIIGKKQSTVWYWANNSDDLPDSAARAILQIHMRYCGPDVTRMRLNMSRTVE